MLTENPEFIRAVQTAREHIPIQRKCRIESALSDYVIVRRLGPYGKTESFHVTEQRGWAAHTGSLLAWSEPTGEQLARVDLDGYLTMIEDDEMLRDLECNGDFSDAARIAQANGRSCVIVATSYVCGDMSFAVHDVVTEEILAPSTVPAGTITRRVVARVSARGELAPAFA